MKTIGRKKEDNQALQMILQTINKAHKHCKGKWSDSGEYEDRFRIARVICQDKKHNQNSAFNDDKLKDMMIDKLKKT